MKSRGNIHLFDRVECNGYLASRKPKWQLVISDAVNFKGVFHSKTWKDGKYHNEDIAVHSEDEFVTNTFYEEKIQRFDGVVIGFKDVVTEAKLYVVTDDYPDGRQISGCYSEASKTVPCAVVAYGDNRKHIVPMHCIRGADDFSWLYEEESSECGS